MPDNISSLAVGLILLDVHTEAKLLLEDECVFVDLLVPADQQTEEQLLSWGWIKIGNLTWAYTHDD